MAATPPTIIAATQNHRNRPYRGTADGLTTALRSRYLPSRYFGIELEVNQRFFSDQHSLAAAALQQIVKCLQDVLSQA